MVADAHRAPHCPAGMRPRAAAAQAAEDGATGEGGRVELLTLEFIRKYIKYAKVRRRPVS